jgi:hypothetical protein
MRTAMIVVYVAMALWLVLAAFARIAIQLAAGQDLDPLPFVGGAIGLVALVLLLPAWEDRRSRNRD